VRRPVGHPSLSQVKNQRIAVAPNSLAPRFATIDGGYEYLHFESIERGCGIEGEHQLGTAPERSPAPLHALAIWPQKDEAIQQFKLVGGLKAAVERRNEAADGIEGSAMLVY
jgi:hypothetical protein